MLLLGKPFQNVLVMEHPWIMKLNIIDCGLEIFHCYSKHDTGLTFFNERSNLLFCGILWENIVRTYFQNYLRLNIKQEYGNVCNIWNVNGHFRPLFQGRLNSQFQITSPLKWLSRLYTYIKLNVLPLNYSDKLATMAAMPILW